MASDRTPRPAGQEFGLLVLQEGKPQQVLAKFLNLMLNYQYGLSIAVAGDLKKAAALLSREGARVRCTCVVQGEEMSSPMAIKALSRDYTIPLFMVLPTSKLGLQRLACTGMEGIHFVAWERAFSQGEVSLQRVVGDALESLGIGNLMRDLDTVPYAAVRQQVERRLRNINTLPTLPEIIMRIMRLINDPKTTPEQLDQVLCTDPSIVMKLLQVMRSPVFTGTGGRTSRWTLKEIITRLGVKKVGAIAQQVKMINSLVKPEESGFDLKRFWEHSVGSAIIADKLYAERLVRVRGEVEYNDYWIGSLLHDVGKLVLGFFFWDWLERVEHHRAQKGVTFRQAETELGDVASHDRVGQLMLLNADMGEEVVAAVGGHHQPAEEPGDLPCLVHLANNLSKDLGLGYLPGEEGQYDGRVLAHLKLDEPGLDRLRERLAREIVEEIRTVVGQCM
ncbi:MAG: HDOD domain-containing protein [Gemmatimonadota bacterium]